MIGEAATPTVRRFRRESAVFAASIAVAAGQLGLAARLEYADDYQMTLGIAWLGALFLAWERRSNQSTSPGIAPIAAGGVVAAGTLAAMIGMPGYHAFYRVLPLVAGLGLAFAATGARAWRRHVGPLLMLGLPLLDSPPRLLHRVLDPVLIPATTWCAMALDRVAGAPAVADGHLLRMPGATLDVVDGCSGLWAITRLAVLAALVAALFPTTPRQRLVLVASTVVLGFAVNAVRVALLATLVLQRDRFDDWHQGRGATLFAVGLSAIAGLVWWAALRRRVPRGV